MYRADNYGDLDDARVLRLLAVRRQPGLAAVPGNPGEYSWNGANGNGFSCDPKKQLVVAFGTAAPRDLRNCYLEEVQDLAYGAQPRWPFDQGSCKGLQTISRTRPIGR
jgi:CubicO group peptidase (beta-lactamase class C family)